MDSTLLAKIHMVSVMIFLLIYVVKTVLLFTSRAKLDSFTKVFKVPEMIVSFLFLVTGSWLFALLGGIKVFHLIKLAFVVLSIPLAIIAFKKYNKGLALVSLLLIIGAYGLGEMSKNKAFIPAKVVVANDDGSQLVTGTRTFAANCAFCHGTDGKKHTVQQRTLQNQHSMPVWFNKWLGKEAKEKCLRMQACLVRMKLLPSAPMFKPYDRHNSSANKQGNAEYHIL